MGRVIPAVPVCNHRSMKPPGSVGSRPSPIAANVSKFNGTVLIRR